MGRPDAPGAVKLSVLDQSVWCAGRSEGDAIRDTVELAVHCEALGYSRFWVSEHHGLPTIVGTAPEIVMAAVAARTRRIRIGSAGVMLPHYSALKVAEQFRVLDSLAPGRIDLGVGRAPGSDMRTAMALNPNAARAADDFPRQIVDLRAWTRGERHDGIWAHPRPQAADSSHPRPQAADSPGPRPPAPGDAGAPEIWVLGSSDYGARLAAHLGLPYAFAYFFMDGQGVEQALDLYRTLYRPSERHPVPQPTICVWALAADDAGDAHRHALSRDRWRIDRLRGLLGPLQSPDEVERRGFTADEMPTVMATRAKGFVGSAGEVGEKLRVLAARLELGELVVNTWAHDPAARRRSYQLLSAEFALPAQA